jgi:hypothetical protein
MKKALAGVAALTVVLGGAILTGTYVNSPQPAAAKALQYGEWRLAIADQPCPVEGEAGWNYLQNNCGLHRTVHDHCLCATKEEEDLTGELSQEEYDALPAKYFRKVAVCDHGDGVRSVEVATLDATTPPGWNCVLIAAKVPKWIMTYRPLRSPLLRKLQQKCCAACAEDCPVRAGTWGQCPYCLLDENCEELLCPE